MSDESETIIEMTEEDMQAVYEHIMGGLPYETPGQLRDAVFDGGVFCHSNCHDWNHPHSQAWVEMNDWLFLMDKSWRNVE